MGFGCAIMWNDEPAGGNRAAMTDLEVKRKALAELDLRLSRGEIDEASYDRIRAKLVAGLNPAQQKELGVTPPARFGPSAGETRPSGDL